MTHHDPLAGTDGVGFYDAPGQEGVDGKDAPPPQKPDAPPTRKRGRPLCADEPLGSFTVRLPTPAHDRIIRLATQRRQTVSEYLRDVIVQLFMNRS